jgi:2-polyprenyl-6-methoxyphenol hydroxylase-like FAD-dependent oxidoreductase
MVLRRQVIGPLATFDGNDNWVNQPYRAGVALIGDVPGRSDPSYGQGQSQAVRDARLLRDQLLENRDSDAHAYADGLTITRQPRRLANGIARDEFRPAFCPSQFGK